MAGPSIAISFFLCGVACCFTSLAYAEFACILCGWQNFMLPKAPPPDTFTCPLVPLVPLMGILINSYMMGSIPVRTKEEDSVCHCFELYISQRSVNSQILKLSTSVVILVWLFVGMLFYFGYGIHHSELRTTEARSKGNAFSESSKYVATSSLLAPRNNQNYGSVCGGSA